jgi:hypothetical protein
MASQGLQNEAVALQDKWFLKTLEERADQASKMLRVLSKPLSIRTPQAVAQWQWL